MALAQNLNLSRLKKRIHDRAEVVYCYVVRTIKRNEQQFRQEGCAPNFQGGRISLCTCKHHMRTFMSASSWKGKREGSHNRTSYCAIPRIRLMLVRDQVPGNGVCEGGQASPKGAGRAGGVSFGGVGLGKAVGEAVCRFSRRTRYAGARSHWRVQSRQDKTPSRTWNLRRQVVIVSGFPTGGS